MNEVERKAIKVKHLIALATGGAAENEARNAALSAVKLIKEYSLEIVAPGYRSGGYRPPPPPPSHSPPRKKRPRKTKKPNSTAFFDGIPNHWSFDARAVEFVNRFVSMLRAGMPGKVYSVPWMLDIAVKADVIRKYEKLDFEKALRAELKIRKDYGTLQTKRGRHGGYYVF